MATNSRFPTKPNKVISPTYFPEDLNASNRNYYTSITLAKYDIAQQGYSKSPSITIGDSIILPLPKRLNDIQTLVWEENSGTQVGSEMLSGAFSAASGLLGPTGGSLLYGIGGLTQGLQSVKPLVEAAYGLAINPFMFMTYQRPTYKEHTLTWTFAPSNERESKTLNNIINTLKKNSLPSAGPGGSTNSFLGQPILMRYPNIALVKLHPDEFTYVFKPCAIISVQVDYTAAGMPSFFKSGAPTIINLTLFLKEIKLWSQENYEEGTDG